MSQNDLNDKKFDVRTLEFFLNRGDISQKSYDQYLKSLPDDEGNSEEVVIKEEPQEGVEEPST